TINLKVSAMEKAYYGLDPNSPANSLGGVKIANEDVATSILGVSVSDSDSSTLTTTLNVGHGTLNVSMVSGLTIIGNGSGTVSLSGTQAQINAALATLTYKGAPNYNGADSLTVTTSDGYLTDTDTVAITVNP